ncbi:TrmB family transcriptional regulator [Haloarculaceae archaeon H-GB2-1]|nr:TrmB family transcriptional regulator [Haloarculaceae archaeon H-GB1-1]MEA5408102.1 TrmB family transcriptional regulator [Haloarculaceae archaeon H-GB2-1]
MDTEGLVATLKEAGLSPYQADAYVTLLELGAASASDIAEASGVPQPRIYDVLASLKDRGYVETYETDSLRARAHSPKEVLEDLQERAERFQTAAEEVEQRWSQPELESNRASIVQRFKTVVERAATFIDEAAYQIQLSVTPEDLEKLAPKLEAAHDRGVSIRLSVHTTEGNSPPDSDLFDGVCLEARHREFPAPFVALIDREKTCFAHHRDSYDEYGVLVNDRTHTYVFHWYFLTCLWDCWPRVYSARGDEFPIEYVDIRQFVRDVSPVLEADATVQVRIQGRDIDTGNTVRHEGAVAEAVQGNPPESSTTPHRLAGQVTVVLETEDGHVSVGGWGAMVEEVEATRLTVVGIESQDGEEPATLVSGE